MSSFSIPLSGLEAESSWLNTISNNLANLNTDGYKDQNLSFGDIFGPMQASSGNGNPIQIGSGVQTEGKTSNFANGNVSSTGVSSNMALQGNGFFVVDNNGQTNYTRNGNFTANSAGQLVNASGELVMGYGAVNGQVAINGPLAPITVNETATIPGQATTTFQATANLDSNSAVGTTFSTPITVYDSLGAAQTLTIQYTNTAPGAWTYQITLPGAATGAAAPTVLSNGNMTFNANGQLTAPVGSVVGIKIAGLVDGAAGMNLTWNLNVAGNPTITQLDSASATSATTQDGFGVGTLTGYSVTPDGVVEGQFSNNQTLALGQVAVASFANVQGLSESTGGDYQSTIASGTALVGEAGLGGNGTIVGGSVEQSNVSLSTEFANMIVAQQGYEANAKALTTINQVTQATMQMIT
jgi:flagellar hook protein FlgE